MNAGSNRNVVSGARGAKAGWKAVCVSAALVFAAACGGDDGGSAPSDNNDDDDTSAKDSGTGGNKDSGTGGNKDAGTGNSKDSGSDSTKDSGTGGDTTTGDPVAGKKLAAQCVVCHTTDYSGAGHYPNITPDKTNGIGSWTDEEISNAFNNGVDKEGHDLCEEMPRYGFDTEQTANLLAFLHSLTAKTKKITEECSQ